MDPSTSPPSSPLSSVASRSPSPPTDYPSPPSSGSSDTGTATPKKRAAPESSLDRSEPPTKKQRVAKPPKELKTERLNLGALNESTDEETYKIESQKLEKLAEVLRSKKKIVVIAGAGMSTKAGIPDFRSSQGLFNTLRTTQKLKSSGKHLFDASVYKDDSATASFHTMVRELSHMTQNAKPTEFHQMLATLAAEDRLLRLYTQNVDGIDTSLPPLATTVPLNTKGPWPKTIQLHGGLEKMVCSKCNDLKDFEGALFEGPEAPSCTECETLDGVRMATGLRSHGIGRLRPRMVLYNEYNPDEDAIGAVSAADLKTRPDAVIVVGTSLKIPGVRRIVKELCNTTRARRGGFTAWINHDPEPTGIELKDCWDLVVEGECDDVACHVGLPRWDDKYTENFTVTTSDEDKAKKGFVDLETKRVQLKPLPVEVAKTHIPTPVASPPKSTQFEVVIESNSMSKDKPKQKQKQSKLSFGINVPATEEKSKKKGGRKPKAKATEQKNRITSTFTASKASRIAIKPEKAGADFPGLSSFSASDGAPMRKVSTTDHRNNSDISSYSKSSQIDCGSSSSFSSAPSTPVQENRPFDRHQTISPKGRLPSGMENLLS